jgi:hypothetical protein
MIETNQKIGHGIRKDQIPIGSHIAFIASDNEIILNTIMEYFKKGVEENENGIIFVDSMTPEKMAEEFDKRGLNSSSQQSLSIIKAEEGYYPEGKFSADEMRDRIKDFVHHSISQGFKAVRAAGEMSWVLRILEDSSELMVYEASLTEFLKKLPVSGICIYDTNKFNGSTIFDVLKTHPFIIINDRIHQNPYFTPASVFLKNYHSHKLI